MTSFFARTSIKLPLSCLFGVALVTAAACGRLRGLGDGADAGGESSDGGGDEGDQVLNHAIDGFPHRMDIFAGEGATRALVFLHGGLGSKESQAYNFGLVSGNRTNDPDVTANWQWLREHSLIAVVPQGQASEATPAATTWSNYVMDSGQDDVAFLRALAADIRESYGVSKVSVVGHSNGAMMVNRMWCESPETFDAYIALSGPSSIVLGDGACAPDLERPYFGMVGELDTVLDIPGNFPNDTYEVTVFEGAPSIVNPILVGEWVQYLERAERLCGDAPALDDATVAGDIESWSSCGGDLRIDHALELDHGLGMPDSGDPTRITDRVVEFIDDRLGSP